LREDRPLQQRRDLALDDGAVSEGKPQTQAGQRFDLTDSQQALALAPFFILTLRSGPAHFHALYGELFSCGAATRPVHLEDPPMCPPRPFDKAQDEGARLHPTGPADEEG
jgi:hypothetical protein